ncbi:hypothetical protein AB0H43_25730 [Hamadaea sp. NPDC050747]|uniref:hypothetical protein n=1 Tax=Hamadaea sp. NPDC050747 TaxID=3155789 RepID=UPI0033E3ABD6
MVLASTIFSVERSVYQLLTVSILLSTFAVLQMRFRLSPLVAGGIAVLFTVTVGSLGGGLAGEIMKLAWIGACTALALTSLRSEARRSSGESVSAAPGSNDSGSGAEADVPRPERTLHDRAGLSRDAQLNAAAAIVAAIIGAVATLISALKG